MGLFSDGRRLQIIFAGLCTVGKNSNYSEEADFWARHPRRDPGLVPRGVWLIPSVHRPKTYVNHTEGPKSDTIKIRPAQESAIG